MSQPPPSTGFSAAQLRQIAVITTVALAVFLFFRFIPTGTNLNHMDFRVSEKNSVDYCDPANPQFIPVIAARSPVKMTLKTEGTPKRGERRDRVRCALLGAEQHLYRPIVQLPRRSGAPKARLKEDDQDPSSKLVDYGR